MSWLSIQLIYYTSNKLLCDDSCYFNSVNKLNIKFYFFFLCLHSPSHISMNYQGFIL